MFAVVNAIGAVSSHLWDTAGRPIPLQVRIAPVPFEHGIDTHALLTLVYLNSGDVSVFDFNQKPSLTTVALDWTKETNSQVGVQLTDPTRRPTPSPSRSPPRARTGASPPAHAREDGPTERPLNSLLYTWAIPQKPGSAEKTNARFVIVGDPWSAFTLGKNVRTASCAGRPN